MSRTAFHFNQTATVARHGPCYVDCGPTIVEQSAIEADGGTIAI